MKMGSIWKRTMIGAVALLMSASLAACGADAESSNTGADGSSTIKVGVLRGTILLLATTVAENQGFFEDAGLDVELVDEPYTSLLPALLGGSVDITAADGSLALSAIKEGQDLTVLPAVTDYDGNLVVRPGSGIDEVADLKGKTIGIVGGAGQSRYFAEDTLKASGIDPKDAKFVNAGDQAATTAAAVANKRVDAAVMATGSLELFRSEGGELDVIASSVAGTSGPYGELAINAWFVTTPDFRKEDSETVDKFCTAMLGAAGFISDEANRKAVVDDIMVHIGTKDPAAAEKVYDQLHTLWANQTVDEDRWNENARPLLEGDTVPYSHWAGDCGV